MDPYRGKENIPYRRRYGRDSVLAGEVTSSESGGVVGGVGKEKYVTK